MQIFTKTFSVKDTSRSSGCPSVIPKDVQVGALKQLLVVVSPNKSVHSVDIDVMIFKRSIKKKVQPYKVQHHQHMMMTLRNIS